METQTTWFVLSFVLAFGGPLLVGALVMWTDARDEARARAQREEIKR